MLNKIMSFPNFQKSQPDFLVEPIYSDLIILLRGIRCPFLKDQRNYELTKGRSGIQTQTWHFL